MHCLPQENLERDSAVPGPMVYKFQAPKGGRIYTPYRFFVIQILWERAVSGHHDWGSRWSFKVVPHSSSASVAEQTVDRSGSKRKVAQATSDRDDEALRQKAWLSRAKGAGSALSWRPNPLHSVASKHFLMAMEPRWPQGGPQMAPRWH